MAIIQVIRKAEYNDLIIDYDIYIDGKNIGKISNGEQKEFDVSLGNHTIYAKVYWYKSKETIFNIEEGTTPTFELENTASFIKFFFIFFISYGAASLILNGINMDNFFVYIILSTLFVALLFPLFHLKNKYIIMKQVE